MAGRSMRDMQRNNTSAKNTAKASNAKSIASETQLTNEQKAQFSTFKKMAKQYEGKSQDQLMAELKQVAAQQKRNGTLNDAQLNNFKQTIAPMLDAQQAQKLNSLLSMLKK